MIKTVLNSYTSALVGLFVGVGYAITSRLITQLFERILTQLNQHHMLVLMILRLIVIWGAWLLIYHYTQPQYQFIAIGFLLGSSTAAIAQTWGML